MKPGVGSANMSDIWRVSKSINTTSSMAKDVEDLAILIKHDLDKEPRSWLPDDSYAHA